MTETCEHKFRVDRVFEGKPLAQFLTCKKCGSRFFGYEGRIGHPMVIHKMNTEVPVQVFENIFVQGIDLEV